MATVTQSRPARFVIAYPYQPASATPSRRLRTVAVHRVEDVANRLSSSVVAGGTIERSVRPDTRLSA